MRSSAFHDRFFRFACCARYASTSDAIVAADRSDFLRVAGSAPFDVSRSASRARSRASANDTTAALPRVKRRRRLRCRYSTDHDFAPDGLTRSMSPGTSSSNICVRVAAGRAASTMRLVRSSSRLDSRPIPTKLIDRYHNQLVSFRIEDEFKPTDVTAIARVNSGPHFDLAVANRFETRRAFPRHQGSDCNRRA